MADRPAPFLFDLDGTLADTLADIAASVAFVRARAGLAALPLPAVRAMVGDGARTLVQRALAELQPDAAAIADALAAYAAHHVEQCTRTVQLYPGVASGLRQLAAAGHPLAVVTNKPERFARAILAHTGVASLLPVVVGGDTLPQKKPDPAPLRAALRALGETEDRGTMVGDGLQDLRAGKACGLRTIAVLYGFRDEALLRQEGADAYRSRFLG